MNQVTQGQPLCHTFNVTGDCLSVTLNATEGLSQCHTFVTILSRFDLIRNDI